MLKGGRKTIDGGSQPFHGHTKGIKVLEQLLIFCHQVSTRGLDTAVNINKISHISTQKQKGSSFENIEMVFCAMFKAFWS
jgi:hypothetical protein